MNRNDADRPEASPLFEVLEQRLLLDGTLEGQAIQLFQASPALFVENQGQWEDASVRYAFEGAGATVLHTDSGLVLHLHQREGDGLADDASSLPGLRPTEEPPAYVSTTVSVTFDGARQMSPAGRERSETQYNYFVGEQSRWRSGVPTFETVAYEGLYEGIDLYTWGRHDSLKYEFHVAPGTDYRAIRISYEGIEAMFVAEDGSLRVQTALGELADEAPLIYQQINGERVEVPGRFVLVDADTYGFEITGPHDPACELVIDPDLAWATYLGGTGNDGGKGIAVDPAGNVYVTGYTRSPNGATAGACDTTHSGEYDAFVAKLDSSGSGLLYYTYLGGDTNEYGYGIAVDPDGNAYVTGRTRSAGWATDGAYDPTHNGGYDVFAAKLNSTGSSLLYCTYLGGDANEYGYGIAVDPDGNAYITGHSRSSGWATAGAYDTTHDGEYDVFVAKLDSTGSSLLYSTYLGGDGYEYGYGIAADAAGEAYVTGWTESSGWATAGAYDATHNGETDVFVAKLNPAGSSLVYCTYLGGEGGDDGYDIGVDLTGNAYVTGHTRSAGWATDGAYGTTHNGGYDVFVAKVSSTGSNLLYSTYLGGDGNEFGYGIAVDAADSVYVTGGTESVGWATGWAYDPTHNGDYDVFVAKLNSTGGRLQYCTYLGGGGGDDGYDVALDAASNAYVTGRTDSSGWATTGFDPLYDGNNDTFVARMWFNEPPTDISLTGAVVSESAEAGMVVGTLSATDPNGDALAFSLLEDAGGRFAVEGTDLVVADGALLDYEAAASHDVTVQVSDGRLTYSETLAIGVTDENEAPTDISISGDSVLEHVPNTTVVGTLGGTDPEGDGLTFSLLDDADGRFGISGTLLVVADGALLDYESAASHDVTVRASDGEFIYSETLTIRVINVNEFAPTDISLSGRSVEENAADGTTVGMLGGVDPDGDSLTFSLLDDAGGRFDISGTDLVVADGALLDYEAATSHDVSVQAGDGDFTYSETFTISVIDKNEPPTDISFAGTAVPENAADGTVVGTLSGADPDGDSLTFSLLDDAGGRFDISGADLVVANGVLLDYESATSHDVTVQAGDGEFTRSETFTIEVAPPLGDPASRLWVGTTDGHWGNPANWSPAFLPGADSAVAFEEFTLHQATLRQDRDVAGVGFRTAGWMIGGRAFTLMVGKGGIDSVGDGVNTVNTGVTLTGDSTWTVAAGNTLNLPGALDAGGHTLTKDGEGVLFLDCLQNHALGSTLTVNRGTVVVNTGAGGTLGDCHLAINVNGALVEFGAAQHLAGLYLNGGMSRLTAGGSNVVVTETLVLDAASVLDLVDNNLVLDYEGGPSPYEAVADWIASAYNAAGGAHWDGPGITSSATDVDSQSLTAIGVIDNSDPNTKIGGLNEFAGVPVDETSVLAAYTWWGDANLDGVVDTNDYDMINTAWLLWTQEGRVPEGGFRWAVGDFNYDGTIDTNDYDKINNAWLLSENAPLAAGAPLPAPEPATVARVMDAVLLARETGLGEDTAEKIEGASREDVTALSEALLGQSAAMPAVPPVAAFVGEELAEGGANCTAATWTGTVDRAATDDGPSIGGALPDVLSLPALEVLGVSQGGQVRRV